MRISRFVIVAVIWAVCIGQPLAQDEAPTPEEPLYPIWENGYWGLINASGKVVLEPRFNAVGQYGSENFLQLPPEPAASTAIRSTSPVMERIIPVVIDGKHALATRDGKVFAAGRYEYMRSHYSEGLVIVKKDGLWGYANEQGDLVVPARYESGGSVRSFDSGYAFVKVDDRWGIIDRQGLSVAPPTWDRIENVSSDNWVKARIGKLWGIIDHSGKVVFPFKYEQIGRPIPPLIFVVEDGKPLYLKEDGSVAFEVTCPGRRKPPKYLFGAPFFEDNRFARFTCGQGNGLIDRQGKFFLNKLWKDSVPGFSEDRVVTGKKWRVMDYEGQVVFDASKFKYMGGYLNGVALFQPRKGNLGLIDRDGKTVIPPIYADLSLFRKGLAMAAIWDNGMLKRGLIDRTGAWVVSPTYRQISNFGPSLAVADKPVSDDTLEVSYITRTGKVVYSMRFRGFDFRGLDYR